MLGQMQNHPLLISSVIDFAARHQGDTEVVSRRVEGDIHRYTYRDLAARSRRLANALDALKLQFSDRVATLATATPIAPKISSTAAMMAAATGARATKVAIPVTATSPAEEAATLVKGSGEVLIASRNPALVRWLARAVRPPTEASARVTRSPLDPA